MQRRIPNDNRGLLDQLFRSVTNLHSRKILKKVHLAESKSERRPKIGGSDSKKHFPFYLSGLPRICLQQELKRSIISESQNSLSKSMTSSILWISSTTSRQLFITTTRLVCLSYQAGKLVLRKIGVSFIRITQVGISGLIPRLDFSSVCI